MHHTSRENFVKYAVLKHIASDEYDVLPLPSLPEFVWEDLEMDEEHWRSINPKKVHPLEIYMEIGESEFEHAIFLMCMDNVRNMPGGYASTMKTILRSPEVIHAALSKLEANASVVNKVDGAFHAFVGAVWEKVCDEDMDEMLLWLEPIFLPLLKKGGAAYVLHVDTYGPKKLPAPTSAAGVRSTMTLQFLKDLHQMQFLSKDLYKRQALPSSPPKPQKTYDYSPKSPPSFLSFGFLTRNISPINPRVLEPRSTILFARTPIQEPFPEFYPLADVPSPSGIEEELQMGCEDPVTSSSPRDVVASGTPTLTTSNADQDAGSYEPPVNSIASPNVQATHNIWKFNVNQTNPQGATSGFLLPAIQLGGVRNVRDRDRVATDIAVETSFEWNLGAWSLKAPGSNQASPSELGKSPRHAAEGPRQPLTPRNYY
ncbi:hypothetical protein FB451DRAFT_510660 [Mycena latifolia]|nr:hypothetical protein FB451DRAFT_510660 [Mycena latifolia]